MDRNSKYGSGAVIPRCFTQPQICGTSGMARGKWGSLPALTQAAINLKTQSV